MLSYIPMYYSFNDSYVPFCFFGFIPSLISRQSLDTFESFFKHFVKCSFINGSIINSLTFDSTITLHIDVGHVFFRYYASIDLVRWSVPSRCPSSVTLHHWLIILRVRLMLKHQKFLKVTAATGFVTR